MMAHADPKDRPDRRDLLAPKDPRDPSGLRDREALEEWTRPSRAPEPTMPR